MTLDKESFAELEWWGRIGLLNNSPIRRSHFDNTIFSDASTTGWGISCNGKLSHGFWKQHERSLSINYLELNAAFLRLQCFASALKDCKKLLRIHNTTAIFFFYAFPPFSLILRVLQKIKQETTQYSKDF